ncbi:MAG: EamA family transporter [Candidatus Micrarchaeota archaeon]|nr:EamA family transporter [Candidatus Micrarchaeota archaeon]MDE1824436.1 EamA family transporter [Candidatus Micrarchaeota archaeon]MDE1850110.1 EamA family transporter [Candidatus Micrarchaeota archaeon]
MLGELGIVLATLGAAGLAAVAQYLFKRSVPKFNFRTREILGLAKSGRLLAGVFVYFVGLALYLYALGSGELSFVYPLFSSTFIFIALISVFVLRERMGIARLSGMALVLIGILLISSTYGA